MVTAWVYEQHLCVLYIMMYHVKTDYQLTHKWMCEYSDAELYYYKPGM